MATEKKLEVREVTNGYVVEYANGFTYADEEKVFEGLSDVIRWMLEYFEIKDWDVAFNKIKKEKP